MSKERLSKLQKWIINRAIENMNKCIEKKEQFCGRPHIYRDEIFRDYYKYGGYPRDVPQKFRVSVSRSLNKLEERGLIRFMPERKCFIVFTDQFCVELIKESEKGS